jgi:hypothetical protein
MALARFDPPGNLDDFQTDGQRDQWSELVSHLFDQRIGELMDGNPGLEECQFFNPTATEPAGTRVTQDIPWEGFPRAILRRFPPDDDRKYEAAERIVETPDYGRHRPQDEYLEWHTERDGAGKVTRVSFTCEGPEYWEALAQLAPDAVLALYRKHVSDEVTEDDLFPGGQYNRLNAWNTERGAMHLTHPANALSAEVFLAADATILRERNGQVLTDYGELVECAQYGDADRFSDPRIGGDVNTLAQKGYRITLENPVGLYIDGLDATGLAKPDGSAVDDYLGVVRGSGGLIVRAVYEVPAAEGFSVGDITIGGTPIQWGGQLAELITMKLTGVAYTDDPVQNPAFGCAEGAAAPPSIAAPLGTTLATRAQGLS